MRRTRMTTLLCVATLIAASTQFTVSASAMDGHGKSRPCVSSPPPRGGPAREVLRIAEQVKNELDLKSLLLRVTARRSPGPGSTFC